VWSDLLSVLTFRAGHNAAVVVAGVSLLGAAAGLVGCLAVLRRRSLMGDAVAHATLPGVAGAFLLVSALRSAGVIDAGVSARSLPVLLAGATIAGVLGVLTVQAVVSWSRGRIGQDAAIGAVLSSFFGAGFVLLSVVQSSSSGDHAGLKTMLLGQAAAMSVSDAALLGAGAGAALLACAGLYKEFRLLCFDEAFARVQGWPVWALDVAMMALVVLVCVVGLQAVGAVMVIALLVTPAAAARFWSDRLGVVMCVSAGLGLLSGYAGSALSAIAPGLPTGAVVVLCAAGLFVVSALVAPRHGVLARALRRAAVRRRIGVEHALRALYELLEASGRAGAPGEGGLGAADARAAMARIGPAAGTGRLRRLGLVDESSGVVRLTPLGRRLAEAAVRRHRLWERYLVERGASSVQHADHPAHVVEHAIDEQIITDLERELGPGAAAGTPESIHPIAFDPGAGGRPGRRGGRA
jgi:manganese/zinc/iron transport system permease protein